jgi:hypothetical protein
VTPTQDATCGIPGCSARAVFASCTAEATVVLCRRHLAHLQLVEPIDERTDEAPVQRAACAGGRG